MKGIQRIIGVSSTILFIQTSFASTGALFQVTETGSPGTVSISLCLNGKGALSCQNYTISKLNLSILTTINHNYPAAGIKINTPGYTIDNIGTVCTPMNNGYCLFSANHSLAKSLTLKGPTPAIQPAIATGFYSSNSGRWPLLASSNDGGMTWAYTINSTYPTLPSDVDNRVFLNQGASCSGSNCIASGYYFINGTTARPLIASSSDGGMTWAYTINSTYPTLPSNINGPAIFTNVSCSDSNCIAAGYYFINGTTARPLVATSNDGGMTWAYTIDSTYPTLPSDIDSNALLNGGASCGSSHCIAAGYYHNNTTERPLVATSNDNGMTWDYTIDSTYPTLPSDINGKAHLDRGTSCSSSHCIAAGYYFINGTTVRPLVATSNDGGITWTYTINSTYPTLPNDIDGEARLSNPSCSGSHCIVTGYYFINNSTTARPLVATSNDGGMTWAYTINSTYPTLPNDINGNAFLNGGASCSGSHCIVTDYYSNGITDRPLVATSNDGGMTWAYTINSTYPTLPSDINGRANLNGYASCNDFKCIATGLYFNGSTNYPLLASSNDGGMTWTYAISSTYPTLPSDINGEARLDGGASVSNSSYLSNSLLFLNKELEKDSIFHK